MENLELLEKIGEGGQGEVYYIKYEGKPMALKWYNKCRPSAEFVDNLKKCFTSDSGHYIPMANSRSRQRNGSRLCDGFSKTR